MVSGLGRHSPITLGFSARFPCEQIVVRRLLRRPRQAGSHSHSNRFTMLWYFSMYHRFSLLYFGIATGRTLVPSTFQTHGQVTVDPSGCTPGRLSSSRATFIRVSTR